MKATYYGGQRLEGRNRLLNYIRSILHRGKRFLTTTWDVFVALVLFGSLPLAISLLLVKVLFYPCE